MLPGVFDESGALIAAFGPGHLQGGHGRRVRRELVMNAPSSNELNGRARRRTSADTPTPQLFVNHPRIELVLDPAVVGADAFPHLPGRFPSPGWDGENDSRAPEWTR